MLYYIKLYTIVHNYSNFEVMNVNRLSYTMDGVIIIIIKLYYNTCLCEVGYISTIKSVVTFHNGIVMALNIHKITTEYISE